MISGLSNAVVIEHAITRLLRALSDGVCVYGVRAWTLLSSVQCYAWTEYKFTCVCVCVCVSVCHTFCQLVYRSDSSTDF